MVRRRRGFAALNADPEAQVSASYSPPAYAASPLQAAANRKYSVRSTAVNCMSMNGSMWHITVWFPTAGR